jgi:hypothetical protein
MSASVPQQRDRHAATTPSAPGAHPQSSTRQGEARSISPLRNRSAERSCRTRVRIRALTRTRDPYSGGVVSSGQATTVVIPQGVASRRMSTVVPKGPDNGSETTVPDHSRGPASSMRAAVAAAQPPCASATANANAQANASGRSPRERASSAAAATTAAPVHAATHHPGRPSSQQASATSVPPREAIQTAAATHSSGEIDGLTIPWRVAAREFLTRPSRGP